MSRLGKIGFEFGLLKRLTSSVTKSTSGYVPIFGYKSDSLWKNPLLRERRNAQYHIMSLCLSPYYLVPMFQSEIYIPFFGWFDTISPSIFLMMLQMVAVTRLMTVKSYYPHVYEVLFNPYTGDMILMREEWSSVLSIWNRRPVLIPHHIPNDESDQYQILPTAEPQGCVFQKVETEIVEGDKVDSHLGYVHYSNIFREVAFDNYINELASSKLASEMISIRFEQDRDYRKGQADFRYGRFDWAVEKEDDYSTYNELIRRKKDFEEKIKHPSFIKKN